jgi:hypothetical protein
MTNNINTPYNIVSPDGEGSVYSTDSSLFNRASSSVIDVGCKGAWRGTRGKGGQCTLSSTRNNSWEHKTKTGKGNVKGKGKCTEKGKGRGVGKGWTYQPHRQTEQWRQSEQRQPEMTQWQRSEQRQPEMTQWRQSEQRQPEMTQWRRSEQRQPEMTQWQRSEQRQPEMTQWRRSEQRQPEMTQWQRSEQRQPEMTQWRQSEMTQWRRSEQRQPEMSQQETRPVEQPEMSQQDTLLVQQPKSYDDTWHIHIENELEHIATDKTVAVSKTLYATKKSILNLLPTHLDNLYVALPAYLVKSGTGEIDDFQLGVTGSIGIDGKWETSAWHECAEEIGVNVQYSSIISKGRLPKIEKEDGDNGKVTHVYGIVYRISEFTPPPRFHYEKIKDDTRKKVICWVLFDSIDDIIKRRRLYSRDKAGKKVVIMTVGELRRLISERKY